MSRRVESVIEVAMSFVGTKESPRNSNNVIFNTHFYGREVSGSEYPWCAAFVWDVFRLAGAAADYCGGGKSASCEWVLNFARVNKCFVEKTELRRGDVVLYKMATNNRAANHIGIVTQASSSRVTAIEGNTAVGNDSDGGEVMVRERTLTNVVGGYRPSYKEDKMDNKEFSVLAEEYLGIAGTGGEHSAWAAEAISVMLEMGIVGGSGTGDFGWKKPLTKETAAQMIYNLVKALKREEMN